MEPTEEDLVLSSESRRGAYDFIRRHPGISISELARRLGVYWTSAALHVAALTRAHLVVTYVVGRRRVLFPANVQDEGTGSAAGILSEPACRRVAEAIVRHPDQRVWEISNILDMSDRAVYHHVKRLVEAGLVSTTKPGMYRGLRPTGRLFAAFSRPEDPRS